MSLTVEEIEFATDLFSGLGPLATRKMMGGLCIYSEGTIFAIIHPEFGTMIKGAGDFKNELNDLGLTQWTYQRPNADSPTAMPYWKLPDSALDDPDEACALARRALAHL